MRTNSLVLGYAMPQRLLQLDDVRNTDAPEKVAKLFQTLGYSVPSTAQPLSIRDLELPTRSAEAVWNAYLIADHSKGANSLQVLLFHLNKSEWETPSTASNRMRSIAQSLCRRPSNFLLLGTLAVLNSRIVWYFLSQITSKLQGGAYAMQTTYVSQIPIPKASPSDCQAISTLVKKCLNAKGQNVVHWEAEINDRVAHLYGLTADEISLINLSAR